MKDILRNKIKTGDIIAYATTDGNCAAMRIGYVRTLNEPGIIGIYVLGGGYVNPPNINKLTKTKLVYGNRIVIIERKVNYDKLKDYII